MSTGEQTRAQEKISLQITLSMADAHRTYPIAVGVR